MTHTYVPLDARWIPARTQWNGDYGGPRSATPHGPGSPYQRTTYDGTTYTYFHRQDRRS